MRRFTNILSAFIASALVGCSLLPAQPIAVLAADSPTCTNGDPFEFFILDASASDDCDSTGGGAIEAHCCCMDGSISDCVTATAGVVSGSLVVEEDNSTVDAAATNLDFTEPDATVVTSSPAGEANVALSGYIRYAGRSSGAQTWNASTDAAGTLTVCSTTTAGDPCIYLGADASSGVQIYPNGSSDGAWSAAFRSTGLQLEGATSNAYETLIVPTDPTADRTVTIPNLSGTVMLVNSSTTLPATCTEGEEYQDTDSAGTERYVCTATNAWTKYAAAGSSGDGTARFRLEHSTTFTAADSTDTCASLDTEQKDSHDGHSTSVNTSRYTIPSGQAGDWIFGTTHGWDTNATSGRHSGFKKNGTIIEYPDTYIPGNAIGVRTSAVMLINDLVAGDYIESCVIQFSGGTRTVQAFEFWGYKLPDKSDVGIVGDHGTQLVQSGTQSVNDSSETAITWETETVDTDDYHAANADSIIVPSGLGGQALVNCTLEFATNGTGIREVRLFKNAAEVAHDARAAIASDVTTVTVTYADMASAQASDYECRAYQTSGGALNVNSTGSYFTLSMLNADEADIKRNSATDLAWYDKDGDGSMETDGSEDLGAMLSPPRYGIDMRNEFMASVGTVGGTYLDMMSSEWYTVASGTNADCGPSTGDSATPGIWYCDTGTTVAGVFESRSNGTAMLFGGGTAILEARIYLGALSTGTQRYYTTVGFFDGWIGSSSVDGCHFYYDDATNSGKWYFQCRSNSVNTGIDTGVTVAATTWYRMTVHVNAAGTLATGCINGANCVTVATNIPTAAGREFGFGWFTAKTIGTTVVTNYIDYLWFNWTATTPR